MQNGHELCKAHAEQFDREPASIRWKDAPRGPRDDETGQWVTRLEQKMTDALGNEATVTELVCRAIRVGTPLKQAALYAGIAESTFHAWMKAGRAEGGSLLERRFVAEVDRALAECVVTGAAKVAASDDWRAHAWLLERRFSEDFGQVTRTNIGNPAGETFRTESRLDTSGLTLEQKRQLLALLEQADAGEIIDAEIIELPARAGDG